MDRTRIFQIAVTALFPWVTFPEGDLRSAPPYPPSDLLQSITWDWSTHRRLAPGSDNWPVTWATDGEGNDVQFASWGDGGGFGGTNRDGRVSLGVARIEGSYESYQGVNRWGGKDPEHPARFGGKSYGILSVGGTLYMWVSPGSNTQGYEEARLAVSSDHGATWERAAWAWTKSQSVVFPTMLQFGRDCAGARDEYVYVYAPRLKDGDSLGIQRPGEIDLMRVQRDAILDRDAYVFFAGLDPDGAPRWTRDISRREPVFRDPEGVGWTVSASYNRGLDRYLLCTEHSASARGNLGIFEAPEPWGPWRTVLYEERWGTDVEPSIPATTFFWNFSNKWAGPDGRDVVLLFTGTSDNDSWNSLRGRFVLHPDAEDRLPPAAPRNLRTE